VTRNRDRTVQVIIRGTLSDVEMALDTLEQAHGDDWRQTRGITEATGRDGYPNGQFQTRGRLVVLRREAQP
jgi:hypothetical protein